MPYSATTSTSVDINRDGMAAISNGGENGLISIIDTIAGKHLVTFSTRLNIHILRITPDGSKVITIDKNKHTIIWESRPYKMESNPLDTPDGLLARKMGFYYSAIDNTRTDSIIIPEGVILHDLGFDHSASYNITISNDGRRAFMIGEECINVFNIEDGMFFKKLPISSDVMSMIISADDKFLIAKITMHKTIVIDIENGFVVDRDMNPPIMYLKSTNVQGQFLVFTPTCKTLLWNVDRGTFTETGLSHEGPSYSSKLSTIVSSSDNSIFVTAKNAQTILASTPGSNYQITIDDWERVLFLSFIKNYTELVAVSVDSMRVYDYNIYPYWTRENHHMTTDKIRGCLRLLFLSNRIHNKKRKSGKQLFSDIPPEIALYIFSFMRIG